MVGRVDEHGCLRAVEAAGQGPAGQLDREWFAGPDCSLDRAQRPALAVAEHAAGGDVGGEVQGGLARVCPANPEGEADGGGLARSPAEASLALAGEAEVVN